MTRVCVMKKPRAVTFFFFGPQKFPVSQSAPSDLNLKLGSFIIICWICAVGFLPPFFPVLLLHLRNLNRSIESVLLLHLSNISRWIQASLSTSSPQFHRWIQASLSNSSPQFHRWIQGPFYFICSIWPLDSSFFSLPCAQFDRWELNQQTAILFF
jgi:hypothetical protein